MKLKDSSELRNKTIQELKISEADFRKQVVKAVLDLKGRKSKNSNIVKNLKLKIAQILTSIKEKELTNG